MLAHFDKDWKPRNKVYIITPNACDGKTLVRGFDMKKYNGIELWWLGNALGHLEVTLSSDNAISLPEAFKYIILVLNGFIKDAVPELSLSVTAAGSLVRKLETLDISGTVLTPRALSKTETEQLRQSIHDFEVILQGEIPRLNIFYITKHRCFDMTMLIEQGEDLLSPVTVNLLGASKKEVVQDISEAARCLAFGFSTAVGFHLYRAIEGIVVEDYFPFLGVVPAEYEKNLNLGNYIKILEGKGVDVKITKMLTHLKDHYRNPIAHPDEFWDINKANSAIGPAISLIDVMVQDIDDKRKAKAAKEAINE